MSAIVICPCLFRLTARNAGFRILALLSSLCGLLAMLRAAWRVGQQLGSSLNFWDEAMAFNACSLSAPLDYAISGARLAIGVWAAPAQAKRTGSVRAWWRLLGARRLLFAIPSSKLPFFRFGQTRC